MFSVAQTFLQRMMGVLMNNKLRSMRKEAVMVHFQVAAVLVICVKWLNNYKTEINLKCLLRFRF
jgi:hypothetical protein